MDEKKRRKVTKDVDEIKSGVSIGIRKKETWQEERKENNVL